MVVAEPSGQDAGVSGTVYLGGGGSVEQEGAVWSAMLQRRPRILYWPFALPQEMLDGAQDWLRAGLDRHGDGLSLTTWTSLGGHEPGELAEFDLLLVGGGNTFQLLREVREHGFTDAVGELLARGGDYYGGSAGAILACDSIAIAQWYDDNEVGITDLAGLGLVRGIALLPHYERAAEPEARRWSTAHQVPVVAVPESSGVIVVGDVMTVAGPEPAWSFNGAEVRRHGTGSAFSVPDLGPGRSRPPGVRARD
jgi:dipeptidase E